MTDASALFPVGPMRPIRYVRLVPILLQQDSHERHRTAFPRSPGCLRFF